MSIWLADSGFFLIGLAVGFLLGGVVWAEEVDDDAGR